MGSKQRKNIRSTAGFSFVELMVVMFILSALAFFTIPYFAAPGSDRGTAASGSKGLAMLVSSLRHKAVKEGKDYLLHLDQTAGRAWITVEIPDGEDGEEVPEKDREDEEGAAALTGLSLDGVEVLNQPDPEATDTIIRFYRQGHSDMALIHMQDEDGEGITLKLHPFLTEPEIIQGREGFDDCT